MVHPRPQHAGHQHHLGHRRVRRGHGPVGRIAVRHHLCRTRSEGARDMTEPVTHAGSSPATGESSTTAKSGVDVAAFASRRTLVLRRFVRNKPAVVSIAILVLLFVGCYALPPLLPYSYSDLDYF